jgi:hypothetical protein
MLQRLLLENGEEIIATVIDRAKKGDRAALALCMERLIPRLKDAEDLAVEQSQEDPQFTTNQHKETDTLDLSQLTQEQFEVLERLLDKARTVDAGSDRGRAPAPEPVQDGFAVPGDGSAPA